MALSKIIRQVAYELTGGGVICRQRATAVLVSSLGRRDANQTRGCRHHRRYGGRWPGDGTTLCLRWRLIGIVARGGERLKDAQQEVERLGGRAVVVEGDVVDPATTERLAEVTEAAFGPIDIWVNNAMASVYAKIWETPPEEFKRVTEVTYLGYVYGTQAALRRMLPRDRGTIVQVGSSLAYRSIPFQAAYCGAKHAIHGFTDSLRSELIRDRKHVRLTMVQLPSMNTPQFVWVKSRLPQKAKPPPPIYQPEIAAEAIHWSAHHPRREFYLGAMTSIGIKLTKLLPAFLDHYLSTRSFGKTSEPRNPAKPDNLWHPAPGNFAAHGPFDRDAQEKSWQLRLSKHRRAISVGALGLAGAAWMLSRQSSKA
ncbi:MAG TPA: SDR family oxidoreductase [Opitutaceae bacterium]|nr:SDR family oxidoreductase [Opitutaceae bacterium]